MRARSIAYIGLGSNLGNRVLAIESAFEKIKALPDTRCLALSGLYQTSPVDLEGGFFLNAVAAIETGMRADLLLEFLLGLEAAMGRTRKQGEPSSRNIDLDLLLYGDTVTERASLTVPHPRMMSRRFVMEPLAELAPDLKIPQTGITAREAAAKLPVLYPDQEIKRLGTLEEVKINCGLRVKD